MGGTTAKRLISALTVGAKNMLVLSRREQETVVFPKLGIRIEVTRLRGKSVALGIDAPRDVRVLRGELSSSDEGQPGCSGDELAGESAASAALVAGPAAGGPAVAGPAASTQPVDEDDVLAFRQMFFAQEATAEREAQRHREHQLRNRINTLTIALHLLQKNAQRNGGLVDEPLLSDAIDELALLEEALQGSRAIPRLDDIQRLRSLPLALIIDDSTNENELMAGYLRQCGFRVAIALDGRAALRMIQQGALPDVVLLDMNMPGLDGRQTIEAIRGNPRTSGLRVFAVSGEDADDWNVAIGKQGVNRWFRKPIQPDRLVREMTAGLPSC